jgi:uncharacterized protein (TIGR03066 family)
VLLAACAMATADDKKDDKKEAKIDAAKLLGKWEPKDPKKGDAFVLEFAKDGTLSATGTVDGKLQTFKGTYKLDGNKLSIGLKTPGEMVTRTLKILSLDDDELKVEPSEPADKGLVQVLKRVKPEK